jgi:hypothetical protein
LDLASSGEPVVGLMQSVPVFVWLMIFQQKFEAEKELSRFQKQGIEIPYLPMVCTRFLL